MKKQVILITGASTGIGLSIAETLRSAGYEVFGTSRKGSIPGKEYSFKMIKLDITDEESVKSAVNEVIEKAGRIDVLVNNAGIAFKWAAVEECSTDLAKTIFETNFFGVHRMTRAVLPHMREQRHGKIINISSMGGIMPIPYGALYCSSKHALEGYTESLDYEVKKFGIHVSTIDPHIIKTGMANSNSPADEEMAVYDSIKGKVSERMLKQSLENSDEPEVIAKEVLKVIKTENPKSRYTPRKAKLYAYFSYYTPSWIFRRILDTVFSE